MKRCSDALRCIDGGTLRIDGGTLCIDGGTLCIDGGTLCIDGENPETLTLTLTLIRHEDCF